MPEPSSPGPANEKPSAMASAWSTATKAYPNGRKKKPPADVGEPVRAAVTAEFAQRLPEPLRTALGLDRHRLPEVAQELDAQDRRLFERLRGTGSDGPVA